MNTSRFYQNLVQSYQTCNLPKKQIEIDWDTVELLDADLRFIDRKKTNGKRIIVFIARDAKTKKKIVFFKPIAKYSESGTKAVRKVVDELIKLGYRLNKAKTLTTALLDLHNPKINTDKVKIKTRLVN